MASTEEKSLEKPSETDSSTLSTIEKRFFDYVGTGNIEEVCRLLADGFPVDQSDDHGMTPLQMAAYKGDRNMCSLLLQHGADVNNNKHESGYTALMFAALSGNKDVVRLLLEHGACTSTENVVHRTASQMAAFVGQHEVVSLINNFFSKEDLEYYCTKRGLEKEPKLPRHLVAPLYKYILIVNLNPVKLVLHLVQSSELLKEAVIIRRVLDLLVEKMMKARDTNEVMAIKFHYLSFVVREAKKSLDERNDDLAFLIKHLLKSNDSFGTPETQELFIQSMLKEFPYPESRLLQQIVRIVMSPDAATRPSASNALTSCINGQRFASPEDKVCSTCGEFHAKSCATCKSVNYCNKECQKLHWFVHKKFCKTLAEDEAKRKRREENQAAKMVTESQDQVSVIGGGGEGLNDNGLDTENKKIYSRTG